ncbi:MAG: hypothetical protein CVU38_12225 [Chloroflexi bacterium HGW-Chloroflexi-1]|nr:MAG: hypothetical protein CVU38_12225 [Chloroflexi bacterium HGW-Chloroflexi-1]
MNKPILNYDRTNDILYLVIRDGEEHHFVETAEGIVVEFDESNQPIGIEIFDASHVLFRAMERSDLALAYD